MPSATDSTVPTSVSSALARVEPLDAALEDACDLVGVDLHVLFLRGSLGNVPAQLLQSVAD